MDKPIKIDLDTAKIPITYPPVEASRIYTNPDQPPVFTGGMGSLNTYIQNHGKLNDPQISIGGVIYIEFILNEEGYAERPKIISDFNNLQCNLEAIRLIRNMPGWIPAENNGEKVKTRMILPVRVTVE